MMDLPGEGALIVGTNIDPGCMAAGAATNPCEAVKMDARLPQAVLAFIAAIALGYNSTAIRRHGSFGAARRVRRRHNRR